MSHELDTARRSPAPPRVALSQPGSAAGASADGDLLSTPVISVVLCTWNRSASLDEALAALSRQDAAPPHEILVVDNASTDDTANVVQRHARVNPRIRYLSEPRPGLSFARNAGIAAARGDVVAFTDDDVRVPPGWLRALDTVARRHPEAACVGGPVAPVWQARTPAWLTARHWGALGVQSYGDEPLRIDARRPLCLIGANVAFRRTTLASVGPFNPDVQRVGHGGGSTEDHEYHVRVWRSGGYGIYDPALGVEAIVDAERLQKRHHRAWQYGHGRHIARMRLAEIERARWRLAGVPAHLLRQVAVDALAWLWHSLRRQHRKAFDHEAHLWFTAGFVRERWR